MTTRNSFDLDPAFPEEIRALWAELHTEVHLLHHHWEIFRQLIGTSSERMELLNEVAGSAFRIIHDEMLNGLQLRVAKLSDPAGTGTRTNATLRSLEQGLRVVEELDVAEEFKSKLDELDSACSSLRLRRNKRIAHADLATALSRRVTPPMGPDYLRSPVQRQLQMGPS